MKINKLSTGMLIFLGIVGGGASMIAVQSHAQQIPAVQTQTTASTAVSAGTTTDIQTPGDTDNVQDDEGGIDKPDAAEVKGQDTDKQDQNEVDQPDATEAPGTETAD